MRDYGHVFKHSYVLLFVCRSMQEGEFSIIGMQLCDSTTGKELVSVERPPNIANVGATLSPVGTSPTTPVEESVS